MGTMMFSCRIPPVGDFGFPARLTYSGLNTGSRRTVRVSLEKLELLAGITIIQQDSADSLHFTRTDLETNVIGRAGHKDGELSSAYLKKLSDGTLTDESALCDEKNGIDFFDVVVWHELCHIVGGKHVEDKNDLLYFRHSKSTCKRIKFAKFFADMRAIENDRVTTLKMRIIN